MADGEAFVRRGEDRFHAENEGGQAQRVHPHLARALAEGAASGFGHADDLRHRAAGRRLALFGQRFREFAAGARRCVRLAGGGVVDELDIGDIFRRLQREALEQGRGDGEIAGRQQAFAVRAGDLVEFGIVGGAEAGGADDDGEPGLQRGAGIGLHHAGLGVVDEDVGGDGERLLDAGEDRNAGGLAAEHRAEVGAGMGAGDAGHEVEVGRRGDGGREGAPDPACGAGEEDADRHDGLLLLAGSAAVASRRAGANGGRKEGASRPVSRVLYGGISPT